jgi:DNA polymerase-3 subunit delta
MTFAEFQKMLAGQVVPPVLLFHGDEPFLSRLGVDLLRKQVLSPGSEAFDFASLTGRETTAEAIVAQASTVPMMSSRRLTVVYGFEQMNPSQRTKLLEYAHSPVEGSCLALVCFERLAGRNKFERQILSSAAVVECDSPTPDMLAALTRRLAEERGVVIDEGGLAVLMDWTDGGLTRIANELDKLACFRSGGGRLGAKDVEAIVGVKASGVRELARAIAEKNVGEALAFFHELVDAGMDETQLVSQLYGLWTALWAVRAGGRRGYAAGFSRHPLSGAEDLRGLARVRTSKEYAKGIGAFYRADTDIRRGVPPRPTVGLLIYELARGA